MTGRDRAAFWVIDDLGGTEAINAVFTKRRFRPHAHGTFLIGVTERGAEMFEARGAHHISPAGSLRFFNPGEVHTGAPPEGGVWAYRCFYPSVQLIADIGRELGSSSDAWFPEMVVHDELRAQALRTALATVEDETMTRLERSTRLRTVLSEIVSVHSGTRTAERRPLNEPKAVANARAFIGDHLATNFSLNDLAQASAMSPFHLVRVFKATTGLTPFAFQMQVRVARARQMLKGGASVSTVASDCGFYDRSHLSRVFTSTVGVSPAAYQAAYG